MCTKWPIGSAHNNEKRVPYCIVLWRTTFTQFVPYIVIINYIVKNKCITNGLSLKTTEMRGLV